MTRWNRPRSLVAEQIFCRLANEGHVWISWYDDLPSNVRRRLRKSVFNICPACLTEEVTRINAHPTEKDYFNAIAAIERELKNSDK